MNKHVRAFVLEWQELTTFLMEFFVRIINYPLQVIILFFVWSLIYSQARMTEIASISLDDLLTYFLVQKLLAITLSSADVSLTVEREITGDSDTSLVIYICRPLNHSFYHLSRRLAPTSLYLLLSFFFLTGLSFIFPSMSFIIQNTSFFMFFFILVLNSFMITFFIHLVLGYFTFWLGESPRWYYYALEALTSGSLIPLNFFPRPIYQVLMLLPMAQVYYFPIAIFLGIETMTLSSLLWFFSWPFILFIISRLLWAKGLKIFDAQGG